MSNIITSGSIYQLGWPGLDLIGNQYKYYFEKKSENGVHQIFTKRKSHKAEEVSVDTKTTGFALRKEEGQALESDTMQTTYTYKSINRQFGLSYSITDWAIANNQYANEFKTKTETLYNSYYNTMEAMAMTIFNEAFNPEVLIGDGEPLASTKHPYVGGVYANTFANPDGSVQSVDFSEAAVEQAIIQMQKFKDQAGTPISANAKYILLPAELQFSGARLLKSMYRIGTSNNDISAIYNMKYIKEGYIVNQYLNNPNNYFLITDLPNRFIYYDRMPFVTDMNTDPKTKTLTVDGMGAYSFMAFTAQGAFCGKGA